MLPPHFSFICYLFHFTLHLDTREVLSVLAAVQYPPYEFLWHLSNRCTTQGPESVPVEENFLLQPNFLPSREGMMEILGMASPVS